MADYTEVCIDLDALDLMMPMNLIIGLDEVIEHVGPTLAKIHPNESLLGKNFFDFFQGRRHRSDESLLDVCQRLGNKIYVNLQDQFKTQLVGTATSLPNRSGIIMNLSFGISVIDAVGNYDLAGSDFAPTDLTLEMLYIVEAKSAALAESSQLNQRLHGAKTVAEADAASDMLTGLCNRRVLEQVLGRLVTRNLPFSLMHVDLDFFKAVNDTLGHAAGDFVLKVASKILTEETREEDTVARVGGDEFVLVFDRLTDPKRLGSIAERIIKRLEEPIEIKEGTFAQISGSIGLVRSSLYDVLESERMMEDADTALYASKERGRACYTMFEIGMPPMRADPIQQASSNRSGTR